MEWLSIITAAISPGLALLAYFYLKDRYHTEPLSWVGKLFVFGILLVFPTIVLQRALVLGLGEEPFLFSFVISAGIEEFMKWFVLYYVIYKHTVFDEPYDGIVYAVSISIGFATLENVIYLMLNHYSFSVFIFRALVPVSGHALFGVVMGYYLGKAKFQSHFERRYLVYSLGLPILWHGLLDWMLLEFKQNWIWLIVPFMILLWLKSIWKVHTANSNSPFRTVYREDEIKMWPNSQ